MRLRRKRLSEARFVVRRTTDGRTWAGPYRWNGTTFTVTQRLWYLYLTSEAAVAAVDGCNLVGVSVVQIA